MSSIKRPLSSSRWAGLFLILAAGYPAGARAAEIRRRDGVHRMAKLAPMVTPAAQLGRREAHTACPASYSLCPASVRGGCCGAGYSCATDSCYATTQGPVTCNGRENYHACGIEVGGGCCPVGSVCERGSKCVPASGGVSYSHDCAEGSFLCPASLGYGCCKNGMACGNAICYSTEPSTYVFTKTETTTLDNDSTSKITSTITTVTTPTSEPESSQDVDDPALLKFYPTSIPKVEPLVTESETQGLTSAQIGGAVGGAIAFLAIVLVAAFFVLRRLKQVAKVIEESKPTPSSLSTSHADGQDYFKPTTDMDDTGSLSTTTPGALSPRSRFRSGTDSSSEPITPFGLRTPNTTAYSSESPTRRHSHYSNADSANGRGTPAMWARDSMSMRGEVSEMDSTTVCSSARTSQMAELDATARIIAELPGDAASPTTATARKKSEDGGSLVGGINNVSANVSSISSISSTSPPGSRPTSHQRTGSGGGGHKRNVSSKGGGTPLDAVSEAGEFHGYYGPVDKVVGQTAARNPTSK